MFHNMNYVCILLFIPLCLTNLQEDNVSSDLLVDNFTENSNVKNIFATEDKIDLLPQIDILNNNNKILKENLMEMENPKNMLTDDRYKSKIVFDILDYKAEDQTLFDGQYIAPEYKIENIPDLYLMNVDEYDYNSDSGYFPDNAKGNEIKHINLKKYVDNFDNVNPYYDTNPDYIFLDHIYDSDNNSEILDLSEDIFQSIDHDLVNNKDTLFSNYWDINTNINNDDILPSYGKTNLFGQIDIFYDDYDFIDYDSLTGKELSDIKINADFNSDVIDNLNRYEWDDKNTFDSNVPDVNSYSIPENKLYQLEYQQSDFNYGSNEFQEGRKYVGILNNQNDLNKIFYSINDLNLYALPADPLIVSENNRDSVIPSAIINFDGEIIKSHIKDLPQNLMYDFHKKGDSSVTNLRNVIKGNQLLENQVQKTDNVYERDGNPNEIKLTRFTIIGEDVIKTGVNKNDDEAINFNDSYADIIKIRVQKNIFILRFIGLVLMALGFSIVTLSIIFIAIKDRTYTCNKENEQEKMSATQYHLIHEV